MNCIFTCTTFFDFAGSDKLSCFFKAIDTFIEKNQSDDSLNNIKSWVVVNEYAENGRTNWRDIVSSKYPFINFYQKDIENKGQAASMNIILKLIQEFTYWIHWEESWYADKPFLKDALDIMNSTDITQLQFTSRNGDVNWMKSGPDRLTCDAEYRYCIVKPTPTSVADVDVMGACCNDWPLYSLLPSINRVSMYNSAVGNFPTDPKLWPFTFEYYFAKKWLKNGGVKAVLTYGPVTRDDSKHVSTYAVQKKVADPIPEKQADVRVWQLNGHVVKKTKISDSVVFAIVLSAIVLLVILIAIVLCVLQEKRRGLQF